ncbi:predicted protein [Chaetomium globosum CBS 148.51]|uniref:Uncharacterized protein n=1 Tax=Chaetomium globosum (strain ATCC 6205 / CBS 148.51 / DSM 1962 / NBRC 6347 / NRRL 1970) TaxID=306901 RepID=Q2H7F8_CHAGB|nr:uncharacterized protein CHGG_05407 [Chaetomium globosum CBS 148.51]EAQ88788.1 predicted protein [Chaetomium globosum CBS 148.51]
MGAAVLDLYLNKLLADFETRLQRTDLDDGQGGKKTAGSVILTAWSKIQRTTLEERQQGPAANCGTAGAHGGGESRENDRALDGGNRRYEQGDAIPERNPKEARRSQQGEELTADSNPDGSNRLTGLLVYTGSPGGFDSCLRVWRGTRDCRTPGSVVFGPTVDSKMGENWNSDTTGLLLCSTRHQSHDCTAREESPRLADGLGEAADVQLSQEARARSGGLKRPRPEARRPPLFIYADSPERIVP